MKMGFERARPKSMAPDEARAVALDVVTAMAADPDLMGGFLAQTGLAAGELRAALAEAGFLIALLDHALQDDATATRTAEAAGREPAELMAARHALSGGEWGVGEAGD